MLMRYSTSKPLSQTQLGIVNPLYSAAHSQVMIARMPADVCRQHAVAKWPWPCMAIDKFSMPAQAAISIKLLMHLF